MESESEDEEESIVAEEAWHSDGVDSAHVMSEGSDEAYLSTGEAAGSEAGTAAGERQRARRSARSRAGAARPGKGGGTRKATGAQQREWRLDTRQVDVFSEEFDALPLEIQVSQTDMCKYAKVAWR